MEGPQVTSNKIVNRFTYRSICILLVFAYSVQSCGFFSHLSHKIKKQAFAKEAPKYIAIQGHLNLQNTHKKYQGILKIYIEKNKKIWFVFKHFLGIEILHGQITAAGIEILNHIDKTYTHQDFSELPTNWSWLSDYPTIEAIILGLPPQKSDIAAKKNTKQNQWVFSKPPWKICATSRAASPALKHVAIENLLTKKHYAIDYSYGPVKKKSFLFSCAQAKLANLTCYISYKKVQCYQEPLAFKFNIPLHYGKT